MFWFVVFPPIVFNAESTYTTDVTGTSVSGVSTTNTATCTSEYDTSLVYSTSGARVVQDFIQGTVRFVLYCFRMIYCRLLIEKQSASL